MASVSNTYGPSTGGGSTQTTVESVVVASGEKIVLGAIMPVGTLGDDIDWGTDTDVGTRVGALTGGLNRLEFWEISAPTAATRTVQLNYDTSGVVNCFVWVVADSDTPDNPTGDTDTAQTTHEVTVPSVGSGDLVFDIAVSSGNITVGADQTEEFATAIEQMSRQDGADGGVMTWTSGVDRDVDQLAIRIPDDSGGPPPSSGRRTSGIGAGVMRGAR